MVFDLFCCWPDLYHSELFIVYEKLLCLCIFMCKNLHHIFKLVCFCPKQFSICYLLHCCNIHNRFGAKLLIIIYHYNNNYLHTFNEILNTAEMYNNINLIQNSRKSMKSYALLLQGAYKSGKPGKLREFEMYSVNFFTIRYFISQTDSLHSVRGLHGDRISVTRPREVLIHPHPRGWSQSPCSLNKIFYYNCARNIPKWLLRWFFTLGFRFIIVLKRLLERSGKPGKLREFHFAKFVSTLY